MTNGQTRQLKSAFLERFCETGNVSQTCREIGMDRHNVYRWQELDDQFAAAFRDAEIRAVDVLETEARRRALGYDTTVVDKEGDEHAVTKYSDVLLIFLLKGARPDKYRDNLNVTSTPTIIKAIERSAWDRV